MDLLFDISAEDVAKLNDGDLRTLVGLLCEAEFRKAGLPLSSITWGGDQNAPDGGLDVLVNSDSKFSIDFIPRSQTGFQVKKPNIHPNKIGNEMKPKGVLRESIKRLIDFKGSYIIASSCTTSDSSRSKRVMAMRQAVAEQDNCQNLHLDFYDSSRLASWIRLHPSLILWLRNRVGRQLKGWQSFGNWSGSLNPNEGYIVDERLRLRDLSHSEGNGMDSVLALQQFRNLLSKQGTSIRLTGLSGVGKTRFVQALFEKVGENPLNPNLAIYTDISDGPTPDPKTLAEELTAQGANVILIVDNCPPDLHSRLTKTCKTSNGKINLLTIEYDVRDDIPDETDVFTLEPSSDDLIEKLILIRYPKIGQGNARTIADAAGGNARVALALAGTVRKSESLSSLRDDELFTRLFRQRNSENDDLLKSAEVCSLVYSFAGTETNDGSELEFLGNIIGIQPRQLFRNLSLLKQRNLVQSRGTWRAILPHAIANRLAKRAFESIQVDNIINSFEKFATARLLKSFSRRLNYLHDCHQAVAVATRWLKNDGLLGRTKGDLNELGMSLLRNITPVAPKQALDFFYYAADTNEKFATRENPDFYKITGLLSSIAYEAETFYKSAKLICRFALTERPEENNNSIRRELGRLFQLYLSGTHADVNTRMLVVSELLASTKHGEQQLGLYLLEKALSTGSFTGADNTFGSRPRDYGWQPKTYEEIFEWYKIYLELCLALTTKPGSLNAPTRKLLSNNLRGLWKIVKLRDILTALTKEIHLSKPWNDGWVAIKSIFLYDGEHLTELEINALKELEYQLRPISLIDKARTIALTSRHDIFDFEVEVKRGEIGKGWQGMRERAEEIGGLVAKDKQVLDELIAELLSSTNERLYSFGRGIGSNCENYFTMWSRISDETAVIPQEKRQYNFVLGFLSVGPTRVFEGFNEIMDSLVEHPSFSSVFPWLQSNIGIDSAAITRIKRHLELDNFNVINYNSITFANVLKSVSETEYIELLRAFLTKRNGISVVIESLYFILSQESNTPKPHSPTIIQFSREMLALFNFSENAWENNGYQIAFLVRECFKEDVNELDEFCRHLKDSLKYYHLRYDYKDVVHSIASTRPLKFLDIFVGGYSTVDEIDDIVANNGSSNPFDGIPEDVVVEWCEANRKHIPSVLNYLTPSRIASSTNKPEWSPVVLRLLEITSDLTESLNSLRNSIASFHWRDGSGAVLSDSLELLQIMESNSREEIINWAKATTIELEERAKNFYEYEGQRNRSRNDTFE